MQIKRKVLTDRKRREFLLLIVNPFQIEDKNIAKQHTTFTQLSKMINREK